MEKDTSPPSILLADDDGVRQETLSQVLAEKGWQYEVVSDLEGVLRALESQEFDLVVTNLLLPDLAGLQTLQEWREHKPSQAVVLVSDEPVEENRKKFFDTQGCTNTVMAPIDISKFRGILERALHQARQSAFDMSVYEHVVCEHTTYRFSSRELGRSSFCLPIFDLLFSAGKIDQEMKYRLHLVFQEAMANGLEHGNLELESEWREEINEKGVDRFSLVRAERLSDPAYADREIIVSSDYTDGTLTISIEDQGTGFDYSSKRQEQLKRSARNTDLLNTHGRGLTLMHQLMDEIRYSDEGRKITLVKKVE